MPGIVFFAAEDEERVGEFYRDEAGAEVWLEQDGCTIPEHGGFNFGFCERDRTEDCGIPTFDYDDRPDVDESYMRVSDQTEQPPSPNDLYGVHHFFAEDPDGRAREFRTFLHPLPAQEAR